MLQCPCWVFGAVWGLLSQWPQSCVRLGSGCSFWGATPASSPPGWSCWRCRELSPRGLFHHRPISFHPAGPGLNQYDCACPESTEGEVNLEERLPGGQHLTIKNEQDTDPFETPISHGPDGGVGERIRCTPVEEYQRSGWKLFQHPFLVGDAAALCQCRLCPFFSSSWWCPSYTCSGMGSRR